MKKAEKREGGGGERKRTWCQLRARHLQRPCSHSYQTKVKTILISGLPDLKNFRKEKATRNDPGEREEEGRGRRRRRRSKGG